MIHRTILLLTCLSASGVSNASPASMDDLMNLPLEQLSDVPVTVTTASRRPEAVRDVASAVYVVSQEDIRRSGATSIPEALRMVPGLEVARIDGNKWAVSARGLNHEFANKLLVMIDGRSVYTPLFGGVFWDALAYPLSDIEKIEVIRGPGASLWGANAVNGVINIITRSSVTTQGASLNSYVGNEEQQLSLRHGAQVSDASHMRVWGHSQHTESLNRRAYSEGDEWSLHKIGARYDSITEHGRLEVDASAHSGRLKDTSAIPAFNPAGFAIINEDHRIEGGHLRAKWESEVSEGHVLSLQTYFDITFRERDFHKEKRQTVDLEFQHHLFDSPQYEWQWGGNLRYSRDDLESQDTIEFTDPSQSQALASLFGQYTRWIADRRGKVVLGSKVSYAEIVNFHFQPTLRASWELNKDHLIWGAISRSVRTPTRYETGGIVSWMVIPDETGTGLPVKAVLVGDGNITSEELTAYEVGMRSSLGNDVSLDTALFYNDYENMLAFRAGEASLELTAPTPHILVPSYYDNYAKGTSYGFETVVQWTASPSWRLELGYSHLQLKLESKDSAEFTVYDEIAGYSPKHQIKLKSFYSFNDHWEFDTLLYYVDDLKNMDVDDYVRLDLRLGWNPNPQLQMSVGVKNALEVNHAEFGQSVIGLPGDVERSFYLRGAYAF